MASSHAPTSASRGALLLSLAALLACGDDPGGQITGECIAATLCPGPTGPTAPTPTTGDDPDDTGGDDPPTCVGCGDDQVCVGGQCLDVPAECPCPLETYCDLQTASCKIGCTRDEECDAGRICDPEQRVCFPGCRTDAGCTGGRICEGLACVEGCRDDADCGAMQVCDGTRCRQGCKADAECPSGQVCDATVCRQGCLSDADCAQAGDICDAAKKLCRAGCRDHADCPLAQICDAVALECVPGCDTDAKCGPGTVCEDSDCVPGCKTDGECGPGTVCQAGDCVPGCTQPTGCGPGKYCFAGDCVPGCGPPGGDFEEALTAACPVGQACIPSCANFKDCEFTCTADCRGRECNSSPDEPWSCVGSQQQMSWCMQRCDVDADCPAPKRCAPVEYPDADPPGTRYCRNPCASADDCAFLHYEGEYLDCECMNAGEFAGKCVIDDGGTYQLCEHYDAEPP